MKRNARGTSLTELFKAFEDIYPKGCIVVLDEIDLMSDKDANKDILYFLSRNDRRYMAVLLSNNPRFYDELDVSIKSSLQPAVIHFKNYDAISLKKILVQRAKAGLKNCDQAILSRISALTTANTNSDVRVGIKTLFYWAINPKENIESHFEKARRDIYVDLIGDLNNKNVLILKSIQTSKTKFVKDIYENYLHISTQKNEQPFSYVYFYNNLSYLQSLGLIIMLSTKVNRTYTNKISLLFNERILDAVFQKRFA